MFHYFRRGLWLLIITLVNNKGKKRIRIGTKHFLFPAQVLVKKKKEKLQKPDKSICMNMNGSMKVFICSKCQYVK